MNETIKQILAKLEQRESILEQGLLIYADNQTLLAETKFGLSEVGYAISVVKEALPKRTERIILINSRPFLKDEVVFSKRRGIGFVDYISDESGNLAVKFTNEYWYDRNGNSLDNPSNEAEAIYHCSEK